MYTPIHVYEINISSQNCTDMLETYQASYVLVFHIAKHVFGYHPSAVIYFYRNKKIINFLGFTGVFGLNLGLYRFHCWYNHFDGKPLAFELTIEYKLFFITISLVVCSHMLTICVMTYASELQVLTEGMDKAAIQQTIHESFHQFITHSFM